MSGSPTHRSSLSRSSSSRPAPARSETSEDSVHSGNEAGPLLKRVPGDDDGLDEWEQDELQLDRDEAGPSDARRVYGGLAKHTLGNNGKGVFEVAFDVAAASLPAAPLLMPYAFNLTGLAIGVPLLFFLAALSWFSHAILAVEGRYVGAASLNGLAASVFPRKYGGQAISEVLVDALTIFVSVGRSVVVLAVSAHLVGRLGRVVCGPNLPISSQASSVR
jgi:hypothetical protein